MNPEENQNNQGDAASTLNSALAPEVPAPEAAPSEAPAAEETPSLDQVAADLTNATPESLAAPEAAPAETPADTPAAPEISSVPETPAATDAPSDLSAPSPEAPLAPETPAPEAAPVEAPASEAVVAPEVTPAAPIAPEAPVAPEAPANLTAPVSDAPADLSTPAPETPADLSAPASESLSPEAPVDTTSAETQPEPSTDFTSEASTSSASFVGDAPEPPKPASEEEDEEPLKPADPVPGSIGSALAYSDATPDHSAPVIKPKKTPMFDFKGNAKLIIMIISAVVLVAIVVIVLLFVMNSTSSKKPSTNKNNSSSNSSQTQPAQPTVSSLTCTLSGNGTKFQGYGNVTSGEENVIAMYSDDKLSSLGINMTLNYGSPEDATSGKTSAEQAYSNKYVALNFTADPFLSTYDVNGNSVTVTHQADAEKITTSNAKVMDLFVLRGEVVSDMETLKDTYETDGFTCVEK